jgi:toxin FitB
MALAATARIHGFVLVTRNLKDFAGREVRLLNPFRNPPEQVGF